MEKDRSPPLSMKSVGVLRSIPHHIPYYKNNRCDVVVTGRN